MNKYSDHDYVHSQLLDYGVDKLMMSSQNFVNLMIQYRLEGVCSVDSTRSSDLEMSSELPNATST
jgi:hypothetical protein